MAHRRPCRSLRPTRAGALAIIFAATPAHASDGGDLIGIGVGFLIGLFVAFLVLRELMNWYWKINDRVALLQEIRDELKTLNRSSRAGATTAPGGPAGEAAAPTTRCTACEAVHPGDLRGQFCDQCGAALG